MSKKFIKRICKNCKLFDPKQSECAVVVLHEGQRTKLPVIAEELCFFESQYFDPNTQSMENFTENIEQVRFWVENEKGEKTDGNGVVKMEYPTTFFSPNIDTVI